jgi:hypothetical protein
MSFALPAFKDFSSEYISQVMNAPRNCLLGRGKSFGLKKIIKTTKLLLPMTL